ncbi:MAG: putative oxidoreductase [Pyrinomonadaceae bacterium]|jgi:putative oxidoreductase|nr:putative oxidoreductase [Pyrinomonadaceae bacterium]MDQ1611919.1 putative oxidoreductase [Pyrinomonadaceae bacterium]MDX6269765.1 putative oxidoreductase [Acidobacteriota bacterium]
MFQSLIATTATWFTLPVRLALGLIFMAHGAQKAFGVWGGPGWSKFLSFPAPFGFMRPTWLWMGAALFAELIGGALVFFGLLTRVGAFFLAITMLVAMVGVHWGGGFFLSNKGIEYTVALLGMSLALLVSGGGRLSVDEKLQAPPRRRW